MIERKLEELDENHREHHAEIWDDAVDTYEHLQVKLKGIEEKLQAGKISYDNLREQHSRRIDEHGENFTKILSRRESSGNYTVLGVVVLMLAIAAGINRKINKLRKAHLL